MAITLVLLPDKTHRKLYRLAALSRLSIDRVVAYLIDQARVEDLPVRALAQGTETDAQRREVVATALYGEDAR